MKKAVMVLFIIVLTIGGLMVGYNLWLRQEKENIYQSLDNVFLEINYGAVDSVTNRFHLPNPSIALNSDDLLDIEDKETLKPLLLNQTNLPENEDIFVILGIEKVFVLHHRTLLKQDTYLHITYTYKNNKLVQDIEISNSDKSLTEAVQNHCIDTKMGLSINKKESLATAYWFSSSQGMPSLQLTEKEEVLAYLKPYGIDEEWIQKKADYMLYDIVLKRWFEKGSQRYSFEYLGNIEIVPLDFED